MDEMYAENPDESESTIAMPIMLVVHIPAAVVRPVITLLFFNIIIPAPRNPTPQTTCAEILNTSPLSPAALFT